MKIRKLIVIGLLGISLFGCTSNIHFDVPTPRNWEERQTDQRTSRPQDQPLGTDQRPTTKPDPKKPMGMVNCPPFKLPSMGAVRPYPVAEIDAVVKSTGGMTKEQADKIREDYVLRLRDDNEKLRKRVQAAYSKYLKDCRQYDADHPDE